MSVPAWAQVTPERREHIERVAALLRQWAGQMRVAPAERDRWQRAAYLHDALRDAPDADLAAWAPEHQGSAELRHGPAAAARAEREGETDRGVLDAVRFHSLGYAGWDEVGRMLYLADYLEPGRSFRAVQRQAMAERVAANPPEVLREVAAERLLWTIQSGWRLAPETVGFWNALAQSR